MATETVNMRVTKYLARKMYGFLRDSSGREAFFHLGSFRPMDGESEPIPPLPGEMVEVTIDFDLGVDDKAPRAGKVQRIREPERLLGVVSKFDDRSGYGFLVENGTDSQYFIHKSEVREGKSPLVGDRVEFYAGEREGKTRACHVLVLGGSDE